MTATTPASRPVPTRTRTTATAVRLSLNIAAGRHLLVCLPAGSTLQSLEGDIQLGFSPLICGQVLCGAERTLVAGQALTPERGAPSTWVRLHNLGRETARVVLTEAVPQRGMLSQARDWMAARWTKAVGANAASAVSQVGAAH